MPKRFRIAAVWITLISFAGESTGAPSITAARFIAPMPMGGRMPLSAPLGVSDAPPSPARAAIPDPAPAPTPAPLPPQADSRQRVESGRSPTASGGGIPSPRSSVTLPAGTRVPQDRMLVSAGADEGADNGSRPSPDVGGIEMRRAADETRAAEPGLPPPSAVKARPRLAPAARFTYFEQGGGLKPSADLPKERRARLRAAAEYGFLEKEDPNLRAGLYGAMMAGKRTASILKGEEEFEYVAKRDASRTTTYRDERGGTYTYDENGVVRAQTVRRRDKQGKEHLVKLVHRYDKARPYGHRNQWIQEADGVKTVQESSPLVFDLDGNGIGTSHRRIAFDLDGGGIPGKVHDILSGDALLVFDSDKDGLAGETGRELFGDNTDLDGDGRRDGYKDGFEALQALGKKAVREGVLEDGALDDLRLDSSELDALGRAYGLGLRPDSLSGQVVSLTEAGVVEVALSAHRSTKRKDFDGRGNSLMRRTGAVFLRSDGTPGTYADLWFGS